MKSQKSNKSISQIGPIFKFSGPVRAKINYIIKNKKLLLYLQGDSGGPFVCKSHSEKFLAGTVSWGYRCGHEMWPGVYTNLSRYIDWIEQNEVKNDSTPVIKILWGIFFLSKKY